MIRPLRADADRLMTWLAAGVGAALVGAALAGSFPAAVATYAIAGILNSYFFAATLAARSEYAPLEARGQVFVWVGALKITAGSAGTALAGAVSLARHSSASGPGRGHHTGRRRRVGPGPRPGARHGKSKGMSKAWGYPGSPDSTPQELPTEWLWPNAPPL